MSRKWNQKWTVIYNKAGEYIETGTLNTSPESETEATVVEVDLADAGEELDVEQVF